MPIDYGFWSALTAPMQTAGQKQEQRDADSLKALQLMQNIRSMQKSDLDQKQAIQAQIDAITTAAQTDLKTTNGLKREKDNNDLKAWHRDYSGYTEIENVIKQYGNIHNARAYGNLDGLITEYRHKIKTAHEDPTEGNPILHRMNNNSLALENYHKYAIDSDNAHLLTKNAIEKYSAWKEGRSDNFIFNGPRKDYLNDDYINTYSKDENVTADSIIGDNMMSIVSDIANDYNLSAEEAAALTQDEMRAWVSTNLKITDSAGVSYINDVPIYGSTDIETTWGTELTRGLDGVSASGLTTVNDILDLDSQGLTFAQAFDKTSGNQWDNLGGVDNSDTGEDYSRWTYIGKGHQLVLSGRVMSDNQELETVITNAVFGKYDDGSNKYRSDKREVNNVSMNGVYDSYGHKIGSKDMISPLLPNISGLWQEDEQMDLDLVGYHVSPKITGVDANGERVEFLLAKTNEEDLVKIKEQYGDAQVNYVMVAELKNTDYLTYSDYYYKEVDMGEPTIQSAINQGVDSENLNIVKNQMATYSQKQSQLAHRNKTNNALKNKIATQIAAGNTEKLDVIANAYDQNLTVGMKMAGVPTKTIQSTMPLVMADLYETSQLERQYPVKLTDGTQEYAVNTASEYMAISAKIFKSGLGNDPRYNDLLEAIKGGPSAYQTWHQRNHPEKIHNSVMKSSRDWAKYFNLQ
jgi:hypothetical protein